MFLTLDLVRVTICLQTYSSVHSSNNSEQYCLVGRDHTRRVVTFRKCRVRLISTLTYLPPYLLNHVLRGSVSTVLTATG